MPTSTSEVSGEKALATDGIVTDEGTDWDNPAALILESSDGSLTYDLGRVRNVGALYVQADANDTYTVWGAVDDDPKAFQQLARLTSAVERGPGLRNRTAEFAPKMARYLKLTAADGDCAYSVSEFAAYCRAPKPFPPAMGRSEPSAPSVAPSSPMPAAAGQKPSSELWLQLGFVLALVAGVTEFARRRKAQSNAKPSGDASRERSALAHRIIAVLFFVSGCAALIYEVVWFHLLRLVIGASAISVAIVLSSFMGGMFLGSLLFSRFVSRSKNPIVVYALLEIGIGAAGLLMPVILPAVKYVYLGLVGYGPIGIALRALIASVLLLPPTALMGATLPAISRRYEQGRRGMAALTSLYAANTIGAVAGCLLSAFYLLAVWDIWVATVTAATLNFGIAVAVFRLKDSLLVAGSVNAKANGAASARAPRLAPEPVFVAAALSGLTSLGAQVIWTRLLTLLFGASVYAFAIILAVFLAGLGIGSLWASRLLRRGIDARRGLLFSQLALVPTMLVGGYLLAEALPYASPPGWIPMSALHVLDIVRAVVVVLPATVFWGTSFPFALAAVGNGHDDVGRATGLVYASNTVGAIVGSLAVSFWLIPYYGTHRAGQALILIAAISAAGLSFSGPHRGFERGTHAKPSSPAVGTRYLWPLAAGALGMALLPPFPKEFLAHGRYLIWFNEADKYPYVSEGAASTVAVHIAPDGFSNFHVSGRVEATNNPNDLRTERLIGHISAFAHPRPESVLVVGLGAGVTAGALTLHPEVKRIVICEIEPRVAGAAQLFAKENYGVLANPRVEVVFDDARHYLATTREKFDIITSDPIHPWVRGNSILFSREYYAIVKEHLKAGGLASQWVPLYETSELAIQIQAKTFMNAFVDGTVWNTITGNRGYDVVFLGGAQPLQIDLRDVQARMDRNAVLLASLREVKLGSAINLLATYGTRGNDMAAWLSQAPINRDFSLKLEYISGLAMNSHHADEIYSHMIAGRTFPEGLFVGEPASLATLRQRVLGEASPGPHGRELR